MTAPRHTPVRIPQAPSAAPLSAQQKKFNRHIERINEERALLSAWQEAIAAYRERHAREVVPLRGSHIALLVELVQHLDAASDDKKLSKAARRTLSEGITDRLADLIDAVPDEATRAGLKEIYNRHSGSDYDADPDADHARYLFVRLAVAAVCFVATPALDFYNINYRTAVHRGVRTCIDFGVAGFFPQAD